MISTISLGDRKPMSRQPINVNSLVTNQFEKTLNVSLFGPTYVRQWIVVTSLLVIRIVTTWSAATFARRTMR